MKIGNVSVKEKIDEVSVFEAIELIASSYFNGSEYQPYYAPYAEKIAIIKYFLDGIEFEDGESIYGAYANEDVKNAVNKFYSDPRFSESAKIMQAIKESVSEKVEYKKQRLIHGADAIESIANTLDVFAGFIKDIDRAIENISNIDLSSITNDDIDEARKLVKKMNDAGTILDAKTISSIIKEAANYNFDHATEEIIDSKNNEIKQLKEEKHKLEDKILEFKKRNE